MRRSVCWMATLLLIAGVCAEGHARGGERAGRAGAAHDAQAYEGVKDAALRATWGALEGVCRISHAVRPQSARFGWYRKRMGPVRTALYDADARTLANCIVHLEHIPRGKPWAGAMALPLDERVVEITHNAGRFDHRIVVVRSHTQLAYSNTDEGDCQIHGYVGDGRSINAFNFYLSGGAKRVAAAEAFLTRTGPYSVRGDVDPGLIGYVHVFDHPYVTEPTAMTGAYRLTEIPSGTYEVTCWHEGFGVHPSQRKQDGTPIDWRRDPPIRLKRRVQIEPGQALSLDWVFEVPAPLRAK